MMFPFPRHCCFLLWLSHSLVLVQCDKSPGANNLLKRFSLPNKQTETPPKKTSLADRWHRSSKELVESRRSELQKEAQRLSKEAQQLAKDKSDQYQQAAFQKADAAIQQVESELERLSKETDEFSSHKLTATEQAAREELTRLEAAAAKETARLSDAAGHATRKTAAALELAARRKLSLLETAAGAKVNRFWNRLVTPTLTTPQPWLAPIISQNLLRILQFAVIVSALGNLMGVGLETIWEEGDFGDHFIPFDVPIPKRLLAGGLEACAAALLLMTPKGSKSFGAALVTLLFGRGASLHWKKVSVEQRSLWVVAVPGAVALVSMTLLINDLWLRPPKDTKKPID